MEAKENRPDACAASGTAKSIYKYFSADAPDIQEELTGPVLPDECAADIVSFCSEQTTKSHRPIEFWTQEDATYVTNIGYDTLSSGERRRGKEFVRMLVNVYTKRA